MFPFVCVILGAPTPFVAWPYWETRFRFISVVGPGSKRKPLPHLGKATLAVFVLPPQASGGDGGLCPQQRLGAQGSAVGPPLAATFRGQLSGAGRAGEAGAPGMPAGREVQGRGAPIEESLVHFAWMFELQLFCQLVGFPLNHQKLNFQQGSRKQPRKCESKAFLRE